MLFVLQNIFLSVKIDFLQEENTKEESRVYLTSQRSKHNFPRLTASKSSSHKESYNKLHAVANPRKSS